MKKIFVVLVMVLGVGFFAMGGPAYGASADAVTSITLSQNGPSGALVWDHATNGQSIVNPNGTGNLAATIAQQTFVGGDINFFNGANWNTANGFVPLSMSSAAIGESGLGSYNLVTSPFTLNAVSHAAGVTTPLIVSESTIYGTFTYNGQVPGYVSITATWSSAVNLAAGALEKAYGESFVQLTLWDTNTLGTPGEQKSDNRRDFPFSGGVSTAANFPTPGIVVVGSPYSFLRTNTDNVILPFNPQDRGYFQAEVVSLVQTTSVVPIPGAMWLLGSGLVGLVGIRRRFWK